MESSLFICCECYCVYELGRALDHRDATGHEIRRIEEKELKVIA